MFVRNHRRHVLVGGRRPRRVAARAAAGPALAAPCANPARAAQLRNPSGGAGDRAGSGARRPRFRPGSGAPPGRLPHRRRPGEASAEVPAEAGGRLDGE
ncbi:hypothetical protein C5C34_04250 [Rathayibacter rathayi]|nr:hypothetical protein C5C34_04250 [Rathayibacter rathayi]